MKKVLGLSIVEVKAIACLVVWSIVIYIGGSLINGNFTVEDPQLLSDRKDFKFVLSEVKGVDVKINSFDTLFDRVYLINKATGETITTISRGYIQYISEEHTNEIIQVCRDAMNK